MNIAQKRIADKIKELQVEIRTLDNMRKDRRNTFEEQDRIRGERIDEKRNHLEDLKFVVIHD